MIGAQVLAVVGVVWGASLRRRRSHEELTAETDGPAVPMAPAA